MTPTLLTFAQQRQLFRLIRETNDAAADIALHPAHTRTRASERAASRNDDAQAALGAFVESITEKPGKVKA